MKIFLQGMKPLLVMLLALVTALTLTLGIIQLRMWSQGFATVSHNTPNQTSDAQKVRILAALRATSTLSASQQSGTLQALSPTTTTQLSVDQRLSILEFLH